MKNESTIQMFEVVARICTRKSAGDDDFLSFYEELLKRAITNPDCDQSLKIMMEKERTRVNVEQLKNAGVKVDYKAG